MPWHWIFCGAIANSYIHHIHKHTMCAFVCFHDVLLLPQALPHCLCNAVKFDKFVTSHNTAKFHALRLNLVRSGGKWLHHLMHKLTVHAYIWFHDVLLLPRVLPQCSCSAVKLYGVVMRSHGLVKFHALRRWILYREAMKLHAELASSQRCFSEVNDSAV